MNVAAEAVDPAIVPEATPSPERWTRTREGRWLLIFVGLAAVGLTALCELRFHELYATTWDFGIYQQAIYSTAHGRAFYESADLTTGEYGSFLQVHSALVLYAVVPLYAAFPDPFTLFAVQAVIVASAAIPLYLLALSAHATPRRALGLSGLFLVAAPTVASTLYDFHIESFVPVVYLTVAFLWQTRRYRWGAIAAGVGFLTMEVVPVLLFFLAAYFLAARDAERTSTGEAPSLSSLSRRVRSLLLDPAARPTWLLFAASLVAYYALLALRYHWFADWFGFPPFPPYRSGYVVGGTPGELGLSLSNIAVGLYGKATYWILLFVLVGALPFWAPRSWILSVPWIAFTILSADTNYTVLGFQYGFIAGAPLFAGAALALARARLPWTRERSADPDRLAPRFRSLRSTRGLTPGRAALLALVVLNLAISPLDPFLSNAAPGAAYNIVYQNPVPLTGAYALADLVPSGATVVASNDLFPLVANNLNAYSLFWGPNSNLLLPFDLQHLPQFAFLAQDRLNAVPPWLSDTVYAPEDFGLRAVAWSSPSGALFLFERGYQGPTDFWGAAPTGSMTLAPEGLSLSPSAKLLNGVPNTPGPIAVSVSGATGQLWSTPGLVLAPGLYTITFWVRAWVPAGFAAPVAGQTVFGADGSPFALPNLYATTGNWSALNSTAFVPITTQIAVTHPIMDLIVRGYAYDPEIGLALSAISIAQVA